MDQRSHTVRVYMVLALGIVGVSFSAILIRFADAPASMIAFYRMFFASILTAPYVAITQAKALRKVSRSHFAYATASGFFLALHFLAFIKSLELTTVASSTVLVCMQPVFTMILGYLIFREKISRVSAVGIGIALAGSVLMGLSDLLAGGNHLAGDLLALTGGLFASLYMIIGRKLRAQIPAASYCLMVYGTCAFLLLIVNVVAHVPLTGYGEGNYLLFFALALVSTVGGHSIFNWALKHLEAVQVSTAFLGEPIGATILALLLLREKPAVVQLVSGAIILTGLYVFLQGSLKKSTHVL